MSSLSNDPDPLIRQLVLEEGERAHVYQDSKGIFTIGVGRNVDYKARGPGLRSSEIRIMLLNDIENVKTQLDNEIPWWRGENQARQRVLIDLCFNMGIGSLMGFKHTLAVLSQGDYIEAARGLANSKWATDVQPSRRDRLIEMLRNGVTIA